MQNKNNPTNSNPTNSNPTSSCPMGRPQDKNSNPIAQNKKKDQAQSKTNTPEQF